MARDMDLIRTLLGKVRDLDLRLPKRKASVSPLRSWASICHDRHRWAAFPSMATEPTQSMARHPRTVGMLAHQVI